MEPTTVTPKPLTLTVDILVKCGAHRASAAKYLEHLNALLPYYSINTFLRVCHFYAQILHESNGLRAVEEYATGEAYEGRESLGNTQPGDGNRFKGRGLVQLTGRANYTDFARRYGVDCIRNPSLLTEPKWAVATALYYWNSRNLNAIADKDDIMKITRIVNGGYNGIDDRKKYLDKCKAALAPLFATI